MAKTVTRVIYKPDSQATDEYIVIVNPDEYKKYKDGDTTIPLADVVDSFKILHSGQGNQGILGTASNQQLDTVFGTHKDVDVVTIILEKGKVQASEGVGSTSSGNTNAARGSIGIDSRGKGLSGV